MRKKSVISAAISQTAAKACMCWALVFTKTELPRRLHSRFRKCLVPMSGSWDSEWGLWTCFPEPICLWEDPLLFLAMKSHLCPPSSLNKDYTGDSQHSSVDKPRLGLEAMWKGPHIKGVTSPAYRRGMEIVFGFRYWIKKAGKLNWLTELSIV